MGIPYFETSGTWGQKAAEDLGCEVIYTGPTTGDAASQANIVQDMITKGVDCIAISPLDASAIEPVLEQAKEAGFDAYYIDHTTALWPQAAAGLPFTAVEFQSKGDAIADLTEDLAAEQKARTVYDNLLRMITEPEVREPLKFLRTSEKETNRTPALAVLRLSAGPGAVYWLREGKSTDVFRLKKDRLFGLLWLDKGTVLSLNAKN